MNLLSGNFFNFGSFLVTALGAGTLDSDIARAMLTIDTSQDPGDLTPDEAAEDEYFRVGIVTDQRNAKADESPLKRIHAPTANIASASGSSSEASMGTIYQVSESRLILNQELNRLPASFSIFA